MAPITGPKKRAMAAAATMKLDITPADRIRILALLSTNGGLSLPPKSSSSSGSTNAAMGAIKTVTIPMDLTRTPSTRLNIP